MKGNRRICVTVLTLCVFMLSAILFIRQPDSVDAAGARKLDVGKPYSIDDTAVFYLSDSNGSTIYRYTISGFKDTSVTDECEEYKLVVATLLDASNPVLVTSGTPSFVAPKIKRIGLYATSFAARQIDWYQNGVYVSSEYHPEYTDENSSAYNCDNGETYYGISIEFEGFSFNEEGYHISSNNVRVLNEDLSGDALGYNHLYDSSGSWNPFMSDTSKCLSTGLLSTSSFFKTEKYDAVAHHVEIAGTDILTDTRKYGLYKPNPSISSFDTTDGTLTLNANLMFFGGLRWNSSEIPEETSMSSDIPVYVLSKEINQYTIQYNANGGQANTTVMPYTVNYGQDFTLGDYFYADGYDFTHYAVVRGSDGKVFCKDLTWKPLSETTGDQWCPFYPDEIHNMHSSWTEGTDVITDTFTFYAQWSDVPSQLTPYTLTVNPNGGTWDNTTSSSSFSLYPGNTKTISDPTRKGYTFTGWTLSGTGSSMSGTTFTMGTADAALKANWSKNAYTVTLKKGIGISEVSGGGSKEYGSGVTIDATLKTGYHWVNWTGTYTAASKNYSFTMPSKAVTLTANGEANTYTIKFDGNGAADGSTAGISATYDKSYTLTANGFTKTGHTFKNWNTKKDGSGTSYADKASVKNLTSTNNGTVTLYAQWNIHSSAIKINPNGGTWNGSTAEQTIKQDYNTTLTIQPPTREGYTFKGWEKSDPFYGSLSSTTGTVTYTFGAANNVSSALTAKWEVNYYNVSLTAGYGIESVSLNGMKQNAAGAYAYGSEVTITAEEMAGYHWINWTGTLGTQENQTYTFTMPANDVSMTANGEANSYTMVFHPNDGGVVTPIPDMTVKYDETVILPYGTPNYAKYTLDGVNITEDILSGAVSLEPVLLEADVNARAVLDAYPSVFTGWSLESNKEGFTPQWKADCAIDAAVLIDKAGVTLQNGEIITLYAMWDDCPWIAAEDLYFTLKEAQEGFITHDLLMSHASAYDREDGSTIPAGDSFKIIDYQETDFTQFQNDGSVTETYRVIDSAGNQYKKMITVHIVDTAAEKINPEGTTRFINEKYYQESFENGGLEEDSVWKTEPEYVETIQKAFENSRNDTPILVFEFSHEEVEQMKSFIETNGVGNFNSEDALQRFYDEFMVSNIVN